MYIVVNEDNRIEYAGDGRVAVSPPLRAVHHGDLTLEQYRVQIEAALPGWDGRLAGVIVDQDGTPVALSPQPTPPAERLASTRAAMLETLQSQVDVSPICRAIWEGAAIDALASAKGWTAGDVRAAERLMLRYALLAGDVPAPAWALASRYEE